MHLISDQQLTELTRRWQELGDGEGINVSALILDMGGSSALTEILPAHDAHLTKEHFRVAVEKTALRWGASPTISWAGDSASLLFWEASHAVHAAIAILSGSLEVRAGLDPTVLAQLSKDMARGFRIAGSVGKLVYAKSGGRCTGMVLDTAGHLLKVCSAPGFIITRSMYDSHLLRDERKMFDESGPLVSHVDRGIPTAVYRFMDRPFAMTGAMDVEPKSGAHIIIPVGPCEVDMIKMSSVLGIKLLAKLQGRLVLEHLLQRWEPHSGRIAKVRFILNDGPHQKPIVKKKCTEFRARLRSAAKHFAGFQNKLEIMEGGKDRTPTETLCRVAEAEGDRFPSRFLMHYCDVWPTIKNDLYASLLNYAHPSNQTDVGHGVLACATKIPRDLFYFSRLPARQGPILANVLRLVAKPFHVIEIDGLTPQQNVHHRFANMAIAVLTKDLLCEIGKQPHAELFQVIGSLTKDYHFSTHVYDGEWNHCDTEHDITIINEMGLV